MLGFHLEVDVFQAFLLIEVVEDRAGRLHGPFDGRAELVGGHQHRLDVKAGTEGDFVDHFVVGGVSHRDEQLVAAQVQRQGLVFLDQGFADQAEGRLAEVEGADVDQRNAVFFGGGHGQQAGVGGIVLDQPGQQRLVLLGGFGNGFFRRCRVEDILGDQAARQSMQIAGDLEFSVHQRVAPFPERHYT